MFPHLSSLLFGLLLVLLLRPLDPLNLSLVEPSQVVLPAGIIEGNLLDLMLGSSSLVWWREYAFLRSWMQNKSWLWHKVRHLDPALFGEKVEIVVLLRVTMLVGLTLGSNLELFAM